ncbi:DUF4097 family beta strand repeat-containing protein [uncultured Paludibaculum sp.]|uniref:DUF4097 family beta strand repeat-containing protein n=1 Tax=uncultured Paludibaculum sp. TaxID=1765020 RepID=UPI002AAA631F|nr:DUF4097 family beta strand repeat-containing protein [uncultured Paludibaculum sp.]
MRRGSLVGPLVLIVIGVVFLLKNIRPELPLFELFMSYWPFLLIAWGGLRLVEILVTYFRGTKLPVSGISGAEWALVIILSVVGSSVWGVRQFTRDGLGRFHVNGVEVFGESFDYSVDSQNLKVGTAPRVVIENVRGNTRIIAGDTDQVTVSGRKTVRAMGRDEADRANDLTKVQCTAAGTTVTISGNQDRADGQRVSTDLEITVPKGASIEARGRYGDFEISDVTGDVNINSDNAGVRLQNIGGRVKVDTRKSDIIRAVDLKSDLDLKGRGRDVELENIAGQVTINGSYSGETTMRKLAKTVRFESAVTDFRVERIPGELQLSLSSLTANNVVGPMTVRARSKDIRLTDVSDSIDLNVDNGNVEILQSKLPVAKINVKVRTGAIELALPKDGRFTLDASTQRGEITNDFDDRLKETSEDRGSKLRGSLGAGPEIKLATSRGELTLRKMGVAEAATHDMPAPPKPPKAPAPPARADNQ